MKFSISARRSHLDMRWIIAALQSSYWGGHLTPQQIMRACDKSLCFGAYVDDHQIGLCRVITDQAMNSAITDMIVQPELRRMGVGSALVEAVVTHPWVRPTICVLASRDARPFYSRFGFREVGGDVMLRDPR